MRRGTFKLMKSVNKSIILNMIRTSQPVSRAQIAKKSKLTPPTVSSIVKELIAQGIVKESELGKSSGGRKPTMLYINNDAFYIIGVDAGPQAVRCILTDLSGQVYEKTSCRLEFPITNDQFLNVLIENIHSILKSTTVTSEKILGIGVAMHGVVEAESGTSLIAPNLKLKNIPIKARLEEEFDLPIKVENDARAMALGESWLGGHGSSNSMVAVNIGHGVGAGIVSNGKLFHGASGLAGEFGHMTIDMNGRVCECGNRGCLQTVISGEGIVKRALEKIEYKGKLNTLTAETIFERAQNNDETSIAVLKETGEMIGIGLTNLIHILNPGKVVLGGGVMKSRDYILPSIKKTIEERALTPQAKETEVTVTTLGKDATLLGAVSLLLRELFSHA